MAYEYRNTKGQTYFLHGKTVTLRNGHQQLIFYFARQAKPKEVLDTLPAGYRI